MPGESDARGRGNGGRATGRGRRGQHRKKGNQIRRNSNHQPNLQPMKKILLLHGNRQSGDILLGRIDRLKKALSRDLELDVIAPDAPHPFSDDDDVDDEDNSSATDKWKRTWWHRDGNTYSGLEESVRTLDKLWNDEGHEFVAIAGFSQGSRLAHIIAILHTITKGLAFRGLKFVMHFSGYGDRPRPDNFHSVLNNQWRSSMSSSILENLSDSSNDYNFDDVLVDKPNLHVMGQSDQLIPIQSSEALLRWYVEPVVYVHPGSHFVPAKKHDVERYVQFIKRALNMSAAPRSNQSTTALDEGESLEKDSSNNSRNNSVVPDEEHAQAQIDEVTALSQIFFSEFALLSKSDPVNPETYDPDDYSSDNRIYEHPIKFSILVNSQEMLDDSEEQLWPPKCLKLGVQYPAGYPDTSPQISLIHEMSYLQFNMQASETLLRVIRKSMEDELGMPCVMGMVYAARDFFQGGGLSCTTNNSLPVGKNEPSLVTPTVENQTCLRPSNSTRIKECNDLGLQIASAMLGLAQPGNGGEMAEVDGAVTVGKGGRWHYTIGLVGKPSAGKSTFFNAATAFARQRGEGGIGTQCEDDDIILGGASMAPHPFTTIDPNIGYCLIPAPAGCPEDEKGAREILRDSGLTLGSSHGRDSRGRRYIPACLKDVAGLVPGAYQGRGRGNKFLDDLTDADVLVHIVDASGSSDAEGNKSSDLKHPLGDLEWVRSELVEWVYFNLSSKWEGIVRRGRQKLVAMFSGYKQSQSFTSDVLTAIEKHLGRNMFDELGHFDEGDLHLLVSTFLAARFPMGLALNKNDISSSRQYITDIMSKLPSHLEPTHNASPPRSLHGAYVGVGLSSHEEMKFIRHHLTQAMKPSEEPSPSHPKFTGRVWECLQSAMSLREPVLIFPINDFKANYATREASLPNHGFIACIVAAGGSAPSQWDFEKKMYKNDAKEALRDVMMMKPGSSVEDVYISLKAMGALEGEFVRAEGAGSIGEKPKQVSKSELVCKKIRILKIMTTKRVAWQKK